MDPTAPENIEEMLENRREKLERGEEVSFQSDNELSFASKPKLEPVKKKYDLDEVSGEYSEYDKNALVEKRPKRKLKQNTKTIFAGPHQVRILGLQIMPLLLEDSMIE